MESERRWTENDVLKLITFYEKNEALWNPACPENSNKVLKDNLLLELGNSLDPVATSVDICKKWLNFKNFHKTEYKKEKAWTKLNPNGVYISKWRFYRLLDFIKDDVGRKPHVVKVFNKDEGNSSTNSQSNQSIPQTFVLYLDPNTPLEETVIPSFDIVPVPGHAGEPQILPNDSGSINCGPGTQNHPQPVNILEPVCTIELRKRSKDTLYGDSNVKEVDDPPKILHPPKKLKTTVDKSVSMSEESEIHSAQITNGSPPRKTDSLTTFGLYVAEELRDLQDERAIALAKFKIGEVLFRAKLGPY